MQLGVVKHPYRTAAMAGAAVFFWLGVFDAVYVLFFQGVMIKLTGMAGWVKMLANLDVGLLGLAGVLYGTIGLAAGVIWWKIISWVSRGLSKAFNRKPRETEDFFALYLFVGLSLAFFVILAGLFFLAYGLAEETTSGSQPPTLSLRIASSVLLCMIFYGLFRSSYWLINRIASLPFVRAVRRPAFHAICAGLTVSALFALRAIPFFFSSSPAETSAQQIYVPERTPSIVFIVLDTIRKDHIGYEGYPRSTTPHLDKIAREAVIFHEAISPSPWTLPSHASMFTGLYPRTHGAVITHFVLDPSFFTLAEFLRACGYFTIGFSANPMVGRVTHLDQGFDRFEEVWQTQGRDPLTFVKIVNRIRRRHVDKGAREINRQIAHWLREQDSFTKPFFLFINYMETHGPYKPPRHYRDLFLNNRRTDKPPDVVNIYSDRFVKYLFGEVQLSALELDDLRSMYDAELAYLDMRLAELMETMRQHEILDEALLIIVGDHGENLGEHRMVDHQLCVYDTLLRVPLLIRFPPLLPKGKQISGTVQLTSLFPTIVDLLGIQEDGIPVAFSTPSVLPLLFNNAPGLPVAFAEYRSPQEILKLLKLKAPEFDVSVFDRDLIAAQDGKYKYILTSNGTDEVYDLTLDPGEENNLYRPGADTEDHPLKKAIHEWLEKVPAYEPKDHVPISQRADPEAMEKLRTLGYIQ